MIAQVIPRFFFGGGIAGLPPNVHCHVGLFDETLSAFLRELPPTTPASFVHVDCDLYSSTKTVLDNLAPRVVPGTVIVFDEYVMYPGWRTGEYKAFVEAAEEHGWSFEYLAISLCTCQAVVRITDVAGGGIIVCDANTTL